MSDPQLTSGGPLQLVEQLAALVRRRIEDEQAIADAHALRISRATSELAQRRAEVDRKHEARRAAAQNPDTMQSEVLKQYDLERASVEQRLRKASRKMRQRYRARLKAAKKKCDRVRAGETSRYDAQKLASEAHISVNGEVASLRRMAMAELALAADKVLAERGLQPPTEYSSSKVETFDQDNHQLYATAMQSAAKNLAAMQSLPSVRLASGTAMLVSCVLFAAVGAVAAGLVRGFGDWLWVGVAAIACGVVGSLLVNRAAAPLARKQTLAHFGRLRGELADAQVAAAGALAHVKQQQQQQLATLAEKRERKMRKAEAARSKERSTLKAALERKLAANAEKVTARLARMDRERNGAIAAASGGLPQRLAELQQQRENGLAAVENDHTQRVAEINAQRDEELGEVEEEWQCALRGWEAALALLEARSLRDFPPWSQFTASEPAVMTTDGIRFGDYLLSPADIAAPNNGEPPTWTRERSYAVPAILSFHDRPALVLLAPGMRRKSAADAMYNATLRVIAAFGPHEVRCTVIDPDGAARRFERLVGQADDSERLIVVAATDWQIERALVEHKEHIERIKQASGELTEPQRVLVVLGLPVETASECWNTLQHVIAHGACGGVTTLAALDAQAPLARTIDEESLAAHSLLLRTDEEGDFRLQHSLLGSVRVALDEPPSADIALRLVRPASTTKTNGRAGSTTFAAARR